MIVQAEVSLYPLGETDLGPRIEGFIKSMEDAGLEVEMGRMSSILTGECAVIFEALSRAYERDAGQGMSVMTIKVSNACPT